VSQIIVIFLNKYKEDEEPTNYFKMENIAEIQFKGLEGFVKDFKAEDQGKAQKEFLVKRIQDFPKFIDIDNRKTYEVLTFIMSNMF
jgi:hypothetical protein